jgi:invasion protein IalB
MFRNLAKFAFASALLAALPASALAQTQAASPAPETPAPAPPGAPQYSLSQSVGDWVVRCVQTTVKSPAPCEVMQTTVNKDTKLRISAFSIAFVPSRDAYAIQIVVPTGVALAKGLQLGTALSGAKFDRCERDGCYVEMLLDNAAIASLSGAGKATTIGVVGYGQANEIKLPVSLNGFPEAMDRMKGYAKDRAVALPNNASPLPILSAPPTPGPVAARGAASAKPAAGR